MRTMRSANAISPTTVNTPATAPLLFQNPPLELELLLAVAAALLPVALTVVGVIGTTLVTVTIPPTPSVVVIISLDELLEIVVTGTAVVRSVGLEVVPVFEVVDEVVVAVVNEVVLEVVPVVLVVPVVDVDEVESVKAVVDEDVVSVSVDDDVAEVRVVEVVSVGDEVVVPGSDTLVLVVDSDILVFKAFSVHTTSQGKTLVGNANRMRMKRGVNKGSDIESGSRSFFLAGSSFVLPWPSFASRGGSGEAVTRSQQ